MEPPEHLFLVSKLLSAFVNQIANNTKGKKIDGKIGPLITYDQNLFLFALVSLEINTN